MQKVEGDLLPHLIKFVENMDAFYKQQGVAEPTLGYFVAQLRIAEKNNNVTPSE